MLSMHDADQKQSQAISILHGSTQSSSIHPPTANQMKVAVSRVSLARCAQGVTQLNQFGADSHIAQVRVIFQLPDLANLRFQSLRSKHLAYIKWFSPFQTLPEPHHSLFKLTCNPQPEHQHSAVIEVSSIHQSVQLFPCFSGPWRVAWTLDNVLEKCDTFFVNSLQNRHMYLTMT